MSGQQRTWSPGAEATAGPARLEDSALVCGQGRFLDDMDPLPGTLTAAIVRSPHPHARIRSVDLGRARRHPGVAAVIGPAEVAAELKPFALSVRTPMPYYPAATDKVRYVGEPVAVVIATDRYVAEDAAELVDVDYEVLPAVVDTRAALDESAPRLHEGADGNVATDRTFTFGDVAAEFAGAARVVSGEYTFPRYSSVPMECYCVIAEWRTDVDGPTVDAWANFHGPFTMMPVMASALGIPMSRLRLRVPADIGGSFGIKSAIYPYVVLMALASKHAGRPVRWTEDRIEHLLASSSGAGRAMRFEAAVTEDGTVRALRADLVDNVGAYLRPPEPSTLYRCYGNLTGAYRIGAVAVRARAVVSNCMPTGLNRGFGGQQLYFGLERLMDRIAVECELDPVELRRRNLIGADEFPYHTPTGGVYDSGDYPAAVDLLVRNAKYQDLRERQREARSRGEYYGIGVATVVDPSATNIGYVGLATPAEQRAGGRGKSGSTEHVRISVDPQGVTTVLLGTVPQGQGHATVARRIVAERLGVPVERVRPVVEMDTASTPWTVTSGSYSSRFAPLLTSALVDATDRIAHTIRLAGAVLLDADPDDLELAGGQVRRRADPAAAVEFRHAAGLVHWDPGALPAGSPARLYEEVAFTPPQSTAATPDDRINSSLCYGFVAELVACRIDQHTLRIDIDQVVTVHDAGTVLDATLLEGQVHGALAHGMGGALFEQFDYSPSGQPISATFLDYLCPTSAEALYPLDSAHLETPSPVTRLGAKGCGEGSSMSLPVAIANAVADALAPHGIDVNSLPLHGNVLHALLERRATDMTDDRVEGEQATWR
jgi:2-furoyl-CoA dehydrogenase large subunit